MSGRRFCAVAVSMVSLVTSGCDILGANTGIEALDENLNAMPFILTGAKAVIPADSGPDGTLFGLLLDDNTLAYAMGTTDANGNPVITDVLLADELGRLIFKEEVRDGGTRLTFASGDAVDIALGASHTMTLHANATVPPSVLVANISASGDVTIDVDASIIYDTLNPAYNDGNGSISVFAPSFILKTMDAGPAAQSIVDPLFVTCLTLGNTVVEAVDLACKIKSLVTDTLPEFALNAACLGFTEMLNQAAGDGGSDRFRAISAIKNGINIGCEGMKAVALGAGAFTKVNPLDTACFVLGIANDASGSIDGQSVPDRLCDALTSPPDLTADDPVTESCTSDGVCDSTCPAGSSDPDCESFDLDCYELTVVHGEVINRWSADQSDSNWCAVLQALLDLVNSGCGTGTTAEEVRGGAPDGCSLSG